MPPGALPAGRAMEDVGRGKRGYFGSREHKRQTHECHVCYLHAFGGITRIRGIVGFSEAATVSRLDMRYNIDFSASASKGSPFQLSDSHKAESRDNSVIGVTETVSGWLDSRGASA